MTFSHAVRTVAVRLRRAVRAVARSLSEPRKSDTDSYDPRDSDTVFQTDAARARATPEAKEPDAHPRSDRPS
jgi:hypothetical protein